MHAGRPLMQASSPCRPAKLRRHSKTTLYKCPPKQQQLPPTCAKAVSTVCTTFDEVQVMVGTCWCASALVFRLVLM